MELQCQFSEDYYRDVDCAYTSPYRYLGMMYMLMEVFQRSERHRLLRQFQAAETEQASVNIIAAELDYVLEPISSENERAALYSLVFAQLRLAQPQAIGLRREDLAGAVGCVVVAMLAVLPSLVPLVLLQGNYALYQRLPLGSLLR